MAHQKKTDNTDLLFVGFCVLLTGGTIWYLNSSKKSPKKQMTQSELNAFIAWLKGLDLDNKSNRQQYVEAVHNSNTTLALQKGSVGAEVALLQKYLNSVTTTFPSSEIDGVFGAKTEKALFTLKKVKGGTLANLI